MTLFKIRILTGIRISLLITIFLQSVYALRLYKTPSSENIEKLKCILHYFDRIATKRLCFDCFSFRSSMIHLFF